nr:C39 family peptidase [Maliibacterium massiliense]
MRCLPLASACTLACLGIFLLLHTLGAPQAALVTPAASRNKATTARSPAPTIALVPAPSAALSPVPSAASSPAHSASFRAQTSLQVGVLLRVPFLPQGDVLPTGCESASALMALEYYGQGMDVDTFVEHYLARQKLYTAGGETYGPHPADAFVGDPRQIADSYGCYAPVIARAMDAIDPGRGWTARTDLTLDALCTQYVALEKPVLVWITTDLVDSVPGRTWKTQDGSIFVWKRNEHCVVLVGFDGEAYYCNDPLADQAPVRYDKARMEACFQQMGMQCVVPET